MLHITTLYIHIFNNTDAFSYFHRTYTGQKNSKGNLRG